MINAENILICIAIPLCICVFFSKGSAKRFIISFICGMLACLFSAYIVGYLGVVRGWEAGDVPVFLSPIIEEIIKLVPIIIVFVLMKSKDQDMLLIALGVGAGFATFENACYILNQSASKFIYILIRGLAVGVMHIVCVVAMTMLLLLMRRMKMISLPVVAGALTMSMTFHGLYNLLASDPGILSYVAFSLPIVTVVVLMIPYQRYFEEDS